MTIGICRGCKRPIRLVRMTGPFAPKGKVWIHEDKDYFPTHQARPEE
jgi:hypothetical protein